MGRYDPLRDHLVRCGLDAITLSFADIESIIERPLPPSAFNYDAWWANPGDSPFTSHSHAQSWHAVGYNARVNRADQTVCFYRKTPCDDIPAAPPIIDWNGTGRFDPVDAGISMAVAGLRAEPHGGGQRIALISCSKSKKPYRCRASELYSASTLFALSYEYARANADRVYIISAKYGLVGENEIIEPYDETLNEKSSRERQAWARGVLNRLGQVCDIQRDEFTILAGRHYYEYLIPHLPHASLPLGRLPLGRRIEFLQRSLANPEAAVAGQASGVQRPGRHGGRGLGQGPDAGTITDAKMLRRSWDAAEAARGAATELSLRSAASKPDLKPGDRVRHDIFGNGTVLSLRPMAMDVIVEILFDDAGRKRLALWVASKHMRRID